MKKSSKLTNRVRNMAYILMFFLESMCPLHAQGTPPKSDPKSDANSQKKKEKTLAKQETLNFQLDVNNYEFNKNKLTKQFYYLLSCLDNIILPLNAYITPINAQTREGTMLVIAKEKSTWLDRKKIYDEIDLL